MCVVVFSGFTEAHYSAGRADRRSQRKIWPQGKAVRNEDDGKRIGHPVVMVVVNMRLPPHVREYLLINARQLIAL